MNDAIYNSFPPAHWAGIEIGVWVNGIVILRQDAPEQAIIDCGLHRLTWGVDPVEWQGQIVGERAAGGGVAFLAAAPVGAVRELGLLVAVNADPGPVTLPDGQTVHSGASATICRPVSAPTC